MGLIAIWSGGVDGLADAADVESVAAMGPAWRRDVERLGPWRLGQGPEFDKPMWLATQPGPTPLMVVVGRCASCLDVAWHLHEAGVLPPFAAVLAGSQWAGRGQLGRRWISPPGNVYGSWVLPGGSASGPADSLVMGYAVLLALRDLGVTAELKWPNDVLVSGRKVAGVLCEQRGETVIAGLGINLESCPGPDEMREAPACPATALAKHEVVVGPLDLWMRVLRAAKAVVSPEGRRQALDHVERHLAYRDRPVWVHPWTEAPFVARVKGLDETGALWVEGVGGRQRVLSASLVAAENTSTEEILP